MEGDFMIRVVVFLAIVSLVALRPAAAETFSVGSGLKLELSLPSDRWTASSDPPGFLSAEIAEHLEHELLAQGKRFTEGQLDELAAKRLSANEVFVFNADSGAVLTIDFSPLNPDEKAPGRSSVAASARYAGQSLEEEEGVAEVEYEVSRTKVPGARHAYRVDARYRHHGGAMKFIGIVGFSPPCWFFLYYQDRLRDQQDFAGMNRVLESIKLHRNGGK